MQRITRNFLLTGSRLTLAAFLLLHDGLARAGDGGDQSLTGSMPAGSPETAVQAPIAAQGLRVYRDPKTGQLGSPPPVQAPSVLTTAEQRMLNRSDQGLQSRTLPGGGVAVNLQGRYRSMAVATVGADGQAAVSCALTPAQAAAALQPGEQTVVGPAD
ncbi:MAG: hypothetical protein WBQ78_11160 [Gammaproteobacteria bacterium]